MRHSLETAFARAHKYLIEHSSITSFAFSMARHLVVSYAFVLLILVTAVVEGAVLPKHKRPGGTRRDGNAGNARNKQAVTVPLSVVGSPTTNIFWTFDVTIGGGTYDEHSFGDPSDPFVMPSCS